MGRPPLRVIREDSPAIRASIVAWFALAALTAQAQETPRAVARPAGVVVVVLPVAGPIEGRRPDYVWLDRPDVVEELKLSAEQRTRLGRLARRAGGRVEQAEAERADEADDDLKLGLMPVPIGLLEQQARTIADRTRDDLRAEADRLLRPAQRARLFQIGLQNDGPAGLLRDDIKEKLAIDDDQAEALGPIIDEARQAVAIAAEVRIPLAEPDLRGPDGTILLGPDDESAYRDRVAAARAAIDGIQEAALKRAGRILRKHQLSTYEKLRGVPFDLARIRPVPAVGPRPAGLLPGVLDARREKP